ncbi:hypothetical protein J008_06397 [Cryptococcus neoformans]|uniref:DUF895 domain membrane protein n=2 Tax=Cryptococcus neoformans TaxID=5207 RepID=J9W0F0_CRYN9|nr:hypothetical protein CNAG_06186 [Cryptococcus neoformans var. grubii H99]XP_012053192.1 hypothetical protein, variant 1 [Cryptococcus neoformans var. grubii H99]XP_012053193.1 hypothetical protein, variant 2 [Cryptococcus neoformans var. grubii H99]AUB28557.1 hypothetical protein CKF44_06186 [Cryptococcus neoformans var. grubii]OWT36059.1 hypothetical protein C362_06367 [Cryptococcus neoformans var. grubii Bt1]OWZ27223.1 hypothetical protein C347_06393 [Cryptococcus neoformans var. grubii A|eukprot:XP_012053191.1 hypothetical protein CNAG_06186 [Cryptococcus neoformans var. grubii H99]
MTLLSRLSRMRVGSARYNSPWTQVVIVGLVCFCSVGMFSAVSGLGAGGTQDTALSDTANAVLYGVFAIMGIFAGSINNVLGPRLTLSIGATGYSLYVGALWAFQVHGTRWFLILAGGLLGVTAALLWAAQGSIMMSYSMEKDKGRAFSLFWSIFQMGTLIGAAIALGIQAHSTLPSVSTGVYLAFMIIQLTAIAISWLILPPHLVVRGDGTIVKLDDAISPKEEARHFLKMFKDWRMLMLFPMFFASNYFYAYQGAITAHLFNGRTRALVSLLTGLGAIVGAILIGVVLDRVPLSRRKRSMVGCLTVIVLNIVIWVGGLVFQVKFTRHSEHVVWDWSDGAAIGPIILLMSYYIGDAAFQGLAYYTMSCITNDPFRLARMAGYYKGVQSAGAAVSFGMDAVATPFLTEHLVSWIILLVSLPLCGYVLWTANETNYEVEGVVKVEDVEGNAVEGPALPTGHHMHEKEKVSTDEKVGGNLTNVMSVHKE